MFALIDRNEWCSGGSVYVDLRTGTFMLYPRLARPACSSPQAEPAVQHGTVGEVALQRLRSGYAGARRAGLSREPCDFVISNGGPEALVITAPRFSAATPQDDGCWSKEAIALHDELFELFGKQAQPRQ